MAVRSIRPSPSVPGRFVFLLALILAHKCHQDDSYLIKAWHTLVEKECTIQQLSLLEREFLVCIDYDTHVSYHDYTHFTRTFFP